MLNHLRTLALGAVLALAATLSAHAQARIALVVGNGAYGAVPSLDNPTADSRLIAQSLERAGFKVTLLTDADQVTLNRAIAQFGRELRGAGEDTTGLFYYAGHGVQSFGNNYLLPTDVALTDAADLPLVGIQAQAVLRQMASARNRTNIVILDACRDNPFEEIASLNDNGLAEMKAPTGTFLSYSTAPGAVALDGLEGNSPFTAALARHLEEPGLAIEQLFKSVRIDVLRATNGRQVPWDTSSLTGDFQFTPALPVDPQEQAAEALWNSVKNTGDPVQILLFLRAHPESARAEEARALLNRLIAAETAPAPQPEEEVAALPEASRATPVPEKPAALPEASERDMIERARSTGTLEDYQAYLDAYPEGTYAELAAFEISILMEKAAAAAPAPEQPTAPAEEPAPEPAAAPVTFDTPLTIGGEGVVGKTLEQLIAGSPLFPPVEGLPEEFWKEKTCSNCHEWHRDNLCDQAQTYLKANAERALTKTHPYGGGLKANLRLWAENECR
ncbi:caspase family protein [Oceaniglobus trochenteri]|uniref:caspase family protein n=1 Tax=Oceaniglobus trochenteri TaxID=2763260 RepID=UPI001CFF8476|nr:caspase family protein [Oceaniglobus trochenteri]